MKKLLLALLLTNVTAYCSSLPLQQKVYICVSAGAKVYHQSKDCRGLKACTHEIKTVTESEAKDKYYRRACKVCY